MIRTIHLLLVLFILSAGVKAQTANDSQNKILFADNFSLDTLGSLPAKWMCNTDGEIVALKKYPGKWLKMEAPGTYLPQLNQKLPEAFTIEFDFILHADHDNYNTTELTIFDSSDSLPGDALFPGYHGIHLNLEDYIVSYICYNKQNSEGEQTSGENRINAIQKDEKARISIALAHQTAHVSVNGSELLTIPVPDQISFNNIRFHLWGSTAEPLVSNFRVVSEK